MKRSAKLIAAASAAAVAVAACIAVAVISRSPAQTDAPKDEITLLDASGADRVILPSHDGDISLKLENGFWYLENDADFPVDQDRIGSVISLCSPLKAERSVAQSPSDRDQYGLGKDAEKMELTVGGQSFSVYLGSENHTVGGVYVSLDEAGEVFLCDTKILEAAHPESKLDIIVKDVYFPSDPGSVISLSSGGVTLQNKGSPASPDPDSAYSIESGGKSYPADKDRTTEIFEALASLKTSQCVYYGEDGDVLFPLTLDAVFTQGDGGTVRRTVYFSDPDGERVFARAAGSFQTCLVDGDTLKKTIPDPVTCLEKKILPILPGKLLSVSSKDRTLTRTEKTVNEPDSDPLTVTEYSLDGMVLDDKEADRILDALTDLTAQSVGFFEPEGEMILALEITYPDSVRKVSFISDGDSVCAVSGGLCWPRADVDDLSELLKIFT